ncbi:hypothetical protein AB7M18_000194 [Pseudomonas viridiflava]
MCDMGWPIHCLPAPRMHYQDAPVDSAPCAVPHEKNQRYLRSTFQPVAPVSQEGFCLSSPPSCPASESDQFLHRSGQDHASYPPIAAAAQKQYLWHSAPLPAGTYRTCHQVQLCSPMSRGVDTRTTRNHNDTPTQRPCPNDLSDTTQSPSTSLDVFRCDRWHAQDGVGVATGSAG